MKPENRAYLDKVKQDSVKATGLEGPPNCFIVYKTDADGQIVGEPLAIFKEFSSLEQKYEKICDDTDLKWGITVGWWWFDDDNKLEGELK